MAKPISQREARALKRRVKELEDREQRQRGAWASEYPGGTFLMQSKWDGIQEVPVTIRTARRLGHAVVVTATTDGLVSFYGLPLNKEDII